jgi:hypothetical protein
MSDPTPSASYADEAAALDELLDERLAEIRAWTDSGRITAVEAASLRVQSLETHIGKIRELRAEYFGETGDTTP